MVFGAMEWWCSFLCSPWYVYGLRSLKGTGLIATVSLYGLVGCSQPSSSTVQDIKPKTVGTTSTAITHSSTQQLSKYQPLRARQEALFLENACSEANCARVKITTISSNYPLLDEHVNASIERYLTQMLSGYDHVSDSVQPDRQPLTAKSTNPQSIYSSSDQSVLATRLQPVLRKLQKLADENKAYGSSTPLSVSVESNVSQTLVSRPHLATVVINSENYLGGAHGSHDRQCINFDLTTNKVVNLDTIIKSGQRKAFNDLAYQAFRQWVNEMQPDADFADYEKLWNFSVTDNFCLSEQGIVLQYSEYEIGPYAVGLPQLILPYTQLTPIIKPEYLPITR